MNFKKKSEISKGRGVTIMEFSGHGGLTHSGISEGKGGLKHGGCPWLGMDIFWNCPIDVQTEYLFLKLFWNVLFFQNKVNKKQPKGTYWSSPFISFSFVSRKGSILAKCKCSQRSEGDFEWIDFSLNVYVKVILILLCRSTFSCFLSNFDC